MVCLPGTDGDMRLLPGMGLGTVTVPVGIGGGRAITVSMFFSVAVFLPEGHNVCACDGVVPVR